MPTQITDELERLQRENQQLQRERDEAKKWKEALENATEVHAELQELFGVCLPCQMPRFAKDKLDHFQQLAEERWQMCEKLASELSKHNPMPNTVKVLSHFRSLQQQKKDE